MRFMVLLRTGTDLEMETPPGARLPAGINGYNDRLVRAGVLLASDALYPPSHAVRIRLSGTCREIMTGPFPDNGDQLAGYWLLQVRSKEEAIEWVKRIPAPSPGETIVEIRQVMDGHGHGPTGD